MDGEFKDSHLYLQVLCTVKPWKRVQVWEMSLASEQFTNTKSLMKGERKKLFKAENLDLQENPTHSYFNVTICAFYVAELHFVGFVHNFVWSHHGPHRILLSNSDI